MATGGLYGSTVTGPVSVSEGAETTGLYGNNTNFGGTYFEYFIFIESATVPSTPTGGSWSFTNNVGTPPSGWSNSPPAAPTNPVYLSIALVNSRSNAALAWSVPGQIFAEGPQGPAGPTGPTGPQGPQGNPGTAATVNAGTTTTGAAGTSASVVNSGTTSAAVFDFTIPRGDTGATGPQGPKGDTGAGVPTGGTVGQVLAKNSSTNYDTSWINVVGGLNYQGNWNASTNSPTLTSSTGTNGYYYTVSVAGSTNLNGITDWQVGDWAIFNGSVWQKIDQTNQVTSVNGQTGAVVLTAADVGALSNVTSTDGSVTITTPSAGVRDLSVAVAAATTNVICQVRNTTGATLTKGTVVYITGATGQLPTVSKAIASSDATSAQTLGVMSADLPNNSNGNVTIIGLVTGMDTSAFSDGQQLYLSGTVAGGYTATKPYAPIHLVYIAVVEYAHPTQGKLFVKVQNGYELDELHNVSAQTPTNGQTIVYNSSTQLWEQSNAPVISGTTINNTVIGGTTPAAGTFTTLTATGQTSLGGDSSNPSFRANAVTGVTRWIEVSGSAAVTPQIVSWSTGAATGMLFTTRGATNFQFTTNSSTSTEQFRVAHTASAVNYVQVTGSATTKGTVISSQGSDSNISSVFQSKGTGAINLAAGSSGVNISNGGTVTAITRTANGSGYTSIPSVAISAPTTAGGVQATANALLEIGFGWTIINAGSGYAVNDVITIVGGTGTSATYGVAAIGAGGSVTSISRFNVGSYSVLPPSPSSTTTTGAGTGFTIANSYQLAATPTTITNAGSGYVEQPTVTFSGGGGSGAAAYATVGAGAVIRALGATGTQSLSFNVPSGEVLRLRDTGSTGTYVMVNTTSSGANILAQGTTNAFFGFNSNGTGAIQFGTNGNTGNTQMQVTHTASAVNYVQVTGAATTARPTISAQGSDSSVGLNIYAKGGGSMIFSCNGTVTALQLNNTSSGVNYLQMAGAVAGSGPVLSTAGGDTNIDLTLTPKGTGVTRAGGSALSAENGIVMNRNIVNTNATIATGYNALSVGPVTIASGVTVTVASGQNYVVI